MHVAELWRYPVKSLRGEMVPSAEVLTTGIRGDREIVVVSSARRRVITSRTHHRLLGLQGSIAPDEGKANIDGLPWDDPVAIASTGYDRRRFRPNILVGGVEGLAERQWEGKRLRLGEVEIYAAQLRARCVMTTYDPDTLEQDRNVLFRIVNEFDGTMALDCSVTKPGLIRVADPVLLLD